jgi:hypothetical protein
MILSVGEGDEMLVDGIIPPSGWWNGVGFFVGEMKKLFNAPMSFSILEK